MTDRPSGLSRFFGELRRRHVVRATVAYAAVAFVVLQAAEIIFPAFDVGDWMLRLLVVFAALGLPLVAVLAWVYEITPRGIRTMREMDAEAGIRHHDVGVLPRLALLAVTVMAVAGAGWWWLQADVAGGIDGAGEATAPTGVPDSEPFVNVSDTAADVPIRSLAVLPLESFSANEESYFARGMHEALISRLSQLGTVRVISRTSVMSYDRSGKPMTQVGRELGVEGIVEGSVLQDGDEVRITVQLIHAPSDTHLWAADYERELKDIIALQREVAGAIAREIQGELSDQVAPSTTLAQDTEAPEADPEAAMEEMKGRMAVGQASPEGMEMAERHFSQALAEDSSYAPALVGLAGARLMQGLTGLSRGDVPSEEVLDSARIYVERALSVDPGSREARELSALLEDLEIDVVGPGRVEAGSAPDAARPPGSRVVRRPPEGGARALFSFGDSAGVGGDSMRVVFMGDSLWQAAYVPAVTEWGSRVASRLAELQARTRAPAEQLRAARKLSGLGHQDRAIEVLRSAVETFPSFDPAWEELEHIHVMQGDLDAVLEVRRDRRASTGPAPAGVPSLDALEEAVADEGLDGYWRWRLEELEARMAAGEEVSAMEMARTHAGLDHGEEAFDYLLEATRRGDPRLPSVRNDPVWDDYRQDERFARLVEEITRFRIGSFR